MISITFEELLAIATNRSNKALDWHHYFLTPSCVLNPDKDYRIILESPDDNYFTKYENKPLDDLEKLENLFFDR